MQHDPPGSRPLLYATKHYPKHVPCSFPFFDEKLTKVATYSNLAAHDDPAKDDSLCDSPEIETDVDKPFYEDDPEDLQQDEWCGADLSEPDLATAIAPAQKTWIITAPAIEKVLQGFFSDHGRFPDQDETARALDISVRDYREVLDCLKDLEVCMLSASGKPSNDEVGAAGHLGRTDEQGLFQCLRNEMQRLLAGAIKNLPNDERLILSLTYDEGLDVKSISVILELMPSDVSRTLTSAHLQVSAHLKKDRNRLNSRAVRAPMDANGVPDFRARPTQAGDATIRTAGEQFGWLAGAVPWEHFADKATFRKTVNTAYWLSYEGTLTEVERSERCCLYLDTESNWGWP